LGRIRTLVRRRERKQKESDRTKTMGYIKSEDPEKETHKGKKN